jgi:hypothetical protein
MSWVDFAVFFIPLLIAVLVYTFVNGMKKPSQPKFSRPAQKIPALPVVTIAANHILVDSNWKLSSTNRAILESLVKRCSLYVIAVVESMSEMSSIRESFTREFEGIIPDTQILFCQTAIGRASMARQLDTRVHLDFDPEAIFQVSIFHKAVFIGTKGVSAPAAVCACESLEQFVNGRMKALLPELAA